jgi:tRNA threonylcarbamoyl adenosine modification protein YeaZ
MNTPEGPTLIIDTSFGLTVGIVGHEPLHDADSRSHVENIEPFIARAVSEAGLEPHDIATVIVGTGPAPFTGLRAGIVSAKAFAFAAGAQILGQDTLEPQAWWSIERHAHSSQSSEDDSERLVLALNDARRKQLYFQLFSVRGASAMPVTEMDIQYPQTIVEAVASAAQQHRGAALDVIGHGAAKYAEAWSELSEQLEDKGVSIDIVDDNSVLHAAGARGLEIFAGTARRESESGTQMPADPLYLRRPDVSLPPPLKPVLK